MQQAATDACSFVEELAKDDFLTGKRTRQAIMMSLTVIGEAATKVMDGCAEFTQSHAQNAKSHGPQLFRHQPRSGVGDGTGMAAGLAQATACPAPGCR